MKSLFTSISTVLIIACTTQSLCAQNTRTDKKAAKEAEVKKMINSMYYVFLANMALPQGGGARSISGSNYDLKVSKNTVISYLPYFGRMYSAPMDASDGGIKLTSTKFSYDAKQGKKGDWNILIKPVGPATSGSKDVMSYRLAISSNGSATLMVTSQNRQPISFDGYITVPDKEN
jgi:hypothetical protein